MLLACGSAMVSSAVAAPRVETVRLSSGAHSSAVVTLSFDHGVPYGDVSKLLLAAGPSGERLYCDKYYQFYDKGEFVVQHQCGGSTTPWGFHIGANLRPTVVGSVNETGMEWTKNGVTQGKMAPHPGTPADYQYHGTFNPTPDGTAVTYSDHFLYRHNIGSGGNADLHIFGSFVVTGNPPPPPPPECRPGRPC